MNSKPSDEKLYNSVKAEIFKKYTKPSAYRSGLLVKKYKLKFRKKHGSGKNPYVGKKTKKGLTRWFREKWKTQDGQTGYSKKSDVFRPTKRVTKKTPHTFSDLSTKEIQAAQREKKSLGRIKNFKFPKGMVEKVIKIIKGPKGKKYTATVQSSKGTRKISFGSSAYEQFKDSTPLKLFAKKNHGDVKRRRLYFLRHSGVPTKTKALNVEKKKSKGKYNAKILSHKFLW